MKKRVLIINHSLQQGGIVRSLMAALRVISPEEYEVTLYVHRDVPDLASLLPDGVTLVVNRDHSHYYRHPRSISLLLLRKLFLLLNAFGPAKKTEDALNRFIHSQKIRRPQKAYFRHESFDTVIAYSVDICTEIALEIPAEKHYAFFHSSKAEFHRDMTERCFPLFNRIVAVSPGVEAVLRDAFPQLRDRIVCISNYVDATLLRQKAIAFPLPSRGGCFRLCTCGRLNTEKGFDLAVKAATILKHHGIGFVWTFAGDGSERAVLEQMIRDRCLTEQIEITGFLLNPYPYIAGCDIYVQPSYEEAQPLAVMEALILGKAIVSTETVGGKTILENGKKGVLTPFTAEGLAEGIESLLRDPVKRQSFENPYTDEDDLRAKREYKEAWNRLLSE